MQTTIRLYVTQIHMKKQKKICSNIQKVMTWFDINNMKVNTDKFEYMVFGKHVKKQVDRSK